MYKDYFDSPIGLIEVTATDKFITGVNVVLEKDHAFEGNKSSAEAIVQLEEYFFKGRRVFNLNLEFSGTCFQQKVWGNLSTITYGDIRSYKDVAYNIGNIKSVRAVANAIGKNRFLIVVPCHRVIGSDGSLTGFSAGIDKKKYLLELEKIKYSQTM